MEKEVQTRQARCKQRPDIDLSSTRLERRGADRAEINRYSTAEGQGFAASHRFSLDGFNC